MISLRRVQSRGPTHRRPGVQSHCDDPRQADEATLERCRKQIERERPAEEDRRRARTGQAHCQGKPELSKAQGLITEELRQAVMHTRQRLATSERRTCRVIGIARSSLQYRPAARDDDALRLAIIRLAKQYGRYACRKVTELFHVEGRRVNHKTVERLSPLRPHCRRWPAHRLRR